MKNVCLSRHRKADLVSFRCCIQTLASLTLLVPQKPEQTSVYPGCPGYGRWCAQGLQKSVAIKPYVKTSHMSNQRKVEFVGDIFRLWSFWGGHGKISEKPILYRKVWSARNIDSATGRVSNYRTSQTANHLEPSNGLSETWESCIPKWYSRLLEFWLIRD
jgi:hypothetical protein